MPADAGLLEIKMKQYDTQQYLQKKATSLGITVKELVNMRVQQSLQKKADELGITVAQLQLQRVRASQERKKLDELWYNAQEQMLEENK